MVYTEHVQSHTGGYLVHLTYNGEVFFEAWVPVSMMRPVTKMLRRAIRHFNSAEEVWFH